MTLPRTSERTVYFVVLCGVFVISFLAWFSQILKTCTLGGEIRQLNDYILLNPANKHHGSPCRRHWVGPRRGLHSYRMMTLCLLWGCNCRSSVARSVANSWAASPCRLPEHNRITDGPALSFRPIHSSTLTDLFVSRLTVSLGITVKYT
jgi:hypothetical protein